MRDALNTISPRAKQKMCVLHLFSMRHWLIFRSLAKKKASREARRINVKLEVQQEDRWSCQRVGNEIRRNIWIFMQCMFNDFFGYARLDLCLICVKSKIFYAQIVSIFYKNHKFNPVNFFKFFDLFRREKMSFRVLARLTRLNKPHDY